MQKAPPDLRARPNLLSIPAGVPFLETLADGLLDGGLIGRGYSGLRGDPLSLSDVRIFLPTRRAVRELQMIFARRLGGAAVLPRIEALGDFDEEEGAFEPLAEADAELPAAVGETERRLTLAFLIRAWAERLAEAIIGDTGADLVSATPSEAISLAIELGRLIDSFETENIDWTDLSGLIPPEHGEAWRITENFLAVAATAWPAFLDERGLIGGAARKNAQLRAIAERLTRNPPQTPVIVAGSTGSNPATADLMEAVAHLPNGAVVLHGLDTEVSDDAWKEIGGGVAEGPPPQFWTHPQFGFHRLLAKLGVQRGEIGVLGREKALEARRRLVSAALLPSDLTDLWARASMDAGAALDGVTLIEAANEREEALAIALALAETLREPGRTAALITPDRNLARRVAAELKRWDIEAEDSAGLPLADSQAGILARLIAEAAAADLAPLSLLPLLRHPEARFGMDGETRRRAVNALEIAVLRGPAPPPGVAGLEEALRLAREPADEEVRYFWHPARRRLGPKDFDAAADLVARLAATLGPLCAYARGGHEAPLAELLGAHRGALEAVADGTEADPDRDTLLAFFDEAFAPATRVSSRLADYPAVFKALLRGKTARSARASHPRLRILGTLEARLLGFDRIVLGGLNETIWPPQVKNDAFLSRPMRTRLGLPPPEWRIGLSAHDFEQALGTKDIVLTRAQKAGGAPSVAARWLQRLAAVAGKDAWTKVTERGGTYLAWTRQLDDTEGADEQRRAALRPPTPRPPRNLRPDRLSVTEIETLIRDPYAIYAKHVLKLQPLDAIGAVPEASDRGTIIHDALAEFTARHDVFAPDAETRLIEIGAAAFATIMNYPDVAALWWPRFRRIAHWFVNWERERRADIARAYSEERGELEWQTAAGRDFRLACRADRLDERVRGGFAVIDYKTGQPPGHKEVHAGFAPQLPLEAALLARGGFANVPAGKAEEFVYVRLTGQSEAGEERVIDLKDRTAADVAEERFAKLQELVNIYEDEASPYRSNTNPKFGRRLNGDYDHLARYAEWSVAPEEEENGEDA